MTIPHVDICMCTFRRPELLRSLLDALRNQRTDGRFSYSIVVTDNDRAESARSVVAEFMADCPVRMTYCVEPVQNIALARNRAVAQAKGDFIAFIDDDEVPIADWLLLLFEAWVKFNADGVLGPVLPRYDEKTPEWYRKAGFYDFRKRYATGFRMGWFDCRTGNVLLKRHVLEKVEGPFLQQFGSGGEDQDFFRRVSALGQTFVWCDEAIAYEAIPPSRYRRSVLLSRALLRGKNTFRHPAHRARKISKALVAMPLYILALPFLLLAGQHRFMKCLAKLAAHTGVLLACIGLNPVTERRT